MSSQTSPMKIPPLTSVRFLAAFYVVLYHTPTSILNSLFGSGNFITRVFELGYVSVSFFFFLSGFVLAIAYLNTAKPLPRRRFFIARFARIYPLLFVCLSFDLAHILFFSKHLGHLRPSDLLATLVTSYAVLEAWLPKIPGLDPPSWSISAEAFFYLLFPLLGPAIWSMRARRVTWLACVLYLIGNLFILLLIPLHLEERLEFNPITHLFVFIAGICLARLFLSLLSRGAEMHQLTRYAPSMVAAVTLLFLIIPVFDLPIPKPYLQHGILLPLYAVLVLALASGNRVLDRLFSTSWFVVLGEASFALYLIHMPLKLLLLNLLPRQPLLGYGLYLVLALALSVASFFWLETPARRWITARAHTRDTESALTLAAGQ